MQGAGPSDQQHNADEHAGDPEGIGEGAEQEQGRTHGPRRSLGTLIGLALLAAAVWGAISLPTDGGRESFLRALEAPWWAWLALVGVAGSILGVTSVTVGLLMNRYGRVGNGEMLCVVSSAVLLNYLPLRPGMFGRLTYHKLVNGIRLTQSATAVIWANVLVLLASVLSALIGMIALRAQNQGMWFALGGSAVLIAGLAGFSLYAHRAAPTDDPRVWRLITALGTRVAEIHLWGLRFWLAFLILDEPIAWPAALLIAGMHTLVLLIPFSGNGVGLSEWFVGFLSVALPVGVLDANIPLATALGVGLVGRAAELAVIVPAGLIGGRYVSRRLSAARARKGAEDVDVTADQSVS